MAKELTHKGLRPAIHSRVWFTWHLEARLEYLRDKRAELADAIVAQHDVVVDHDWAALYAGAGEEKGWPLAGEVKGL